jgi:hypothetical protein
MVWPAVRGLQGIQKTLLKPESALPTGRAEMGSTARSADRIEINRGIQEPS